MALIFIYTLKDPIDNQIKYVGKTNNVIRRKSFHTNNVKKSPTKVNNWTKKIIKNGLKPIFEILEVVDENNWIFWEKYWISQFKTWGFPLKNISEGGESGSGRPPWNKGLKYKSPNISKAVRGEKNGFYNKKHLKKTKEKISKTKTGVFYTTKFSRKIIQFDLLENQIKIFDSLSIAARETGAWAPNIIKCCNGTYRQSHGFVWKFYEEI